MQVIKNLKGMDFDAIPIDPFWNTGNEKELRMHRIHSYPARFPAFITSKAFAFAKQESKQVSSVADIFCGCGTVAFEARRANVDFWGCDINPVATLIARTKSRRYQKLRLINYRDSILQHVKGHTTSNISYREASDRLRYWYKPSRFRDLMKLKVAIEASTPKGSDYRLFFLCAFSNILKSTSQWLTKSIKPQLDPEKTAVKVLPAFMNQCDFMLKANEESDLYGNADVDIRTANILDSSSEWPQVDMIVTSPPYVTSYEYADLHQLSALWLGFATDYRDLRYGSVGSLHHSYSFEQEIKRLNGTADNIVFRLLGKDKGKARAVAKYFLDMQRVAKVCYGMLPGRGMAFFVIGNTEYLGVRIDNIRHLCEALSTAGFKRLSVSKRKISRKILTPFRDRKGRFTTDGSGKRVYNEEFILVAQK